MPASSSMDRDPAQPVARAQRDIAYPSSRSAGEARRWASTLINRNVTVGGRRTSMRLEPPMWEALQQVCHREGKPLNRLVTDIERERVEFEPHRRDPRLSAAVFHRRRHRGRPPPRRPWRTPPRAPIEGRRRPQSDAGAPSSNRSADA